MTDFLTKLEELKEKATKGPWSVDPDDRPDMEWNNHIVQVGTDNTICFMAHDPRDNSGQQAAAELIVYLVNHAEALRDLVAAAERALNHAEFLDEANKETDALTRASILGGIVTSIIDDLKPALAKLEEQ